MTIHGRSLVVGALVISANAASAQQAPQPPTDPSTIVVIGEKPTRQAIASFVRDLTPVASSGEISRLEHTVCPVAFGLPQAQLDAVARRMRLVAKSVGLLLGGDTCTPNVMVIVTADKKALLEQIRKQRPDYLVHISPKQVDQFENFAGPAVAWQLSEATVNSDGVEIPWDPKSGWYVNRTVTGSSRLLVTARPRFYASMVIVERSALAGLTTTQLADYAAMRAYTGADPARLGGSTAPTILRVLEAPMGTPVPVTMTRWDYGFLHGFYATRWNVPTPSQRSSIADSMAKEIRAAKADR